MPITDDITKMASGFPVGMGGTVACAWLLSVFSETVTEICCRVLTKGMALGSSIHMQQCISFTDEVVEEIVKIIISLDDGFCTDVHRKAN